MVTPYLFPRDGRLWMYEKPVASSPEFKKELFPQKAYREACAAAKASALEVEKPGKFFDKEYCEETFAEFPLPANLTYEVVRICQYKDVDGNCTDCFRDNLCRKVYRLKEKEAAPVKRSPFKEPPLKGLEGQLQAERQTREINARWYEAIINDLRAENARLKEKEVELRDLIKRLSDQTDKDIKTLKAENARMKEAEPVKRTRSDIAQRILDETPQETRDLVKAYADLKVENARLSEVNAKLIDTSKELHRWLRSEPLKVHSNEHRDWFNGYQERLYAYNEALKLAEQK